MVATATRKLVGGRFMAMTTGPDRSMPDAATAATGVITACTGAVLPGNTGAAPPTATGEYQRGNRCHAECRRPR